MIRVTIDLLPGGREADARTIGQIDIANVGTDAANFGCYQVVMKKTPPFSGALRLAWKRGIYPGLAEDEDIMQGYVEGHHRSARGIYDLLYSALRACGMEARQHVRLNKPTLAVEHKPKTAQAMQYNDTVGSGEWKS